MNTHDPITAAAVTKIQAACCLRDSWRLAHDALLASGIVPSPLTALVGNCANASAESKDMLRELDRSAQRAMDDSLLAWIGARRRVHTWRRLRDRTVSEWRLQA